jgi:hypothetical protein
LVACTAPVSAAPSSDPAVIAADVLIGRPLCLVATILGGAVFVVSLPVAASTGGIDSAADALVGKPARATFVRPLGDFGYSSGMASVKGKPVKHTVRVPKHESPKSRG